MSDTCFIAVRRGRIFDILNPRAEQIEIEDIAHGLSRQFRWGGMADVDYTVAQHCVEVSKRLDPVNAMWGLLHDAAEAYLSDFVRPLKSIIFLCDKGNIEHLHYTEDRILHVVAERFDLPWPVPGPVFDADDLELRREVRDLFRPPWPKWMKDYLPADGAVLESLDYTATKRLFLDHFEELKT